MIRAAVLVAHPPRAVRMHARGSLFPGCKPLGKRHPMRCVADGPARITPLALRNGRRPCGYQSSGRRRLVAARPDREPDVAVTHTQKQKPRPRLTAWAKQSGHLLWVQKPVGRFPDDGIADSVLYPHGGNRGQVSLVANHWAEKTGRRRPEPIAPALLVLRTFLGRGMTGTFCPNRCARRVGASWGVDPRVWRLARSRLRGVGHSGREVTAC